MAKSVNHQAQTPYDEVQKRQKEAYLRESQAEQAAKAARIKNQSARSASKGKR